MTTEVCIRAMGLANWLTVVRIVLIPAFVTLLVYRRATAALVVFCLAGLTDALDGYIARTRGRETRLGAFLDPMADKLLLTASFVTLTYLKVLPFWITVIVLSRDLMLFLGAALIHLAGGQVHPAPTLLGKVTTVLQMGTVLTAMLSRYFHMTWLISGGFIWTTAVLTAVSGIQYLYQGAKVLNTPAEREPHDSSLVR